jgi:phage tail sheath gpL-like
MGANVVASNILYPGVAVRVDLVTSDLAIGGATRKACILAAKTTAGTATVNTVYPGLRGPERFAELGGNGALGHLQAKALFKEHPAAKVDFIAVSAPSGTQAEEDITFDDTTPVTVAQTVTVNIMGRDFTLVWAAGETDTAFAARFVTEINGRADDHFVIATSALGVLTIKAKHNGTVGNDILISVSMSGGTGGSATAGAAALSAGTGVLDFDTALAAINTTEYDLILLCCGNTDAIAASTTGVVGKLKTHMETYISGFNALLQQAIIGVTGTLNSAKVGPATHNYGLFEYVFCRSGRSLPCEWAGAEAGARLREEQIDVNVNRTNRQDMPYKAVLYGPADLTTGALSFVDENDALESGLSPVRFNTVGTPLISIPRTTYWKDVYANEDRRLVYVSQPTTLIAIARDLRNYLPTRFPGCKITPDQTEGQDDIPPNVVTIGDVKAVIIARLLEFVALGAIVRSRLEEAIADGTFFVEIDAKIPAKVVPGISIFDINVMGVV